MKQKAAGFWCGTTALISIFIVLFLITLMTSCSSSAVTSAPPSPEATKEPTDTLEPTPSPSSTPTPSPSPTVTPTPLGGSGVVLLDLRPTTFDDYLGIFALDVVSGEFTRVTDDGYALEAVSPNGDKFLVSQSENLMLALLNESEFVAIAQNFLGNDSHSTRAYWLPGTDTIVFLGQDQGQDYVYSVREDGTDLKKITQQGAELWCLANTHSSNSIMWLEQDKNSIYFAPPLWHKANMDGSNQETLKEIRGSVYSPTGAHLAYWEITSGFDVVFYIASADLSEAVQLALPIEFDLVGRHYGLYIQWIRGGKNLLVSVDEELPSYEIHQYSFIFSASGALEEEVDIPFPMSDTKVSPDGLQLFLTNHDLYLLDLLTYEVTPLEFDLPEDQAIASMMWLY